MAINENKLKKSLSDGSVRQKSTPRKHLIKEDKGIARQNHQDVYDELLDINKENNRLLKKIISHQRWATFAAWIKILIIIVPLAAAYFYLPPLLKQIMNNYRSAIGTMNSLKGAAQEIETSGSLKRFNGLENLLK